MTMKISNYSGTENIFTFPNNPLTFDDAISANYTITPVKYQRYHYFVSGGGIAPKQIVLQGHFFGSSKNTNYSTLAGHFIENTKLKKLYFDSDRFYLGFGKEIKKTHSGGRTNFLDYVATFETVVGVLFDDTQQTYTQGGDHKTNSGNTTTFIEEISGTYDGSGDVVISDGLGNQISIPESAFSGSQEYIIKFVEMITSGDGIYITEFNYTTIAGTQTKKVKTDTGFGIIQLASGASTSTISVSNTNANYTIKFRNAYA